MLLEIFFVAVMLPKVMASSVVVVAGVSSPEAAGADPEVESLMDPNWTAAVTKKDKNISKKKIVR